MALLLLIIFPTRTKSPSLSLSTIFIDFITLFWSFLLRSDVTGVYFFKQVPVLQHARITGPAIEMTTLCNSKLMSHILSLLSKRNASLSRNFRPFSSSYPISHLPAWSSLKFYSKSHDAQIVQVCKRFISASHGARVNQRIHKEDESFQSEEELDQTKPYKIYDGALTTQLKHVKLFSIMTSAMGVVMQPIIWNSTETPLAATIAVLGMVGFFTYVTPFLIHTLAKKYVTEIIYDPQKEVYSAATYSFFLTRREVSSDY